MALSRREKREITKLINKKAAQVAAPPEAPEAKPAAPAPKAEHKPKA